ncbi:hypothetical protein [Litorisediminicola beolgyonensis]|uniref:Uncharacterized protein n=1 Tax=Litorisediminicola beolgyonensis TaxID=1173614 RepID=A0ABW3ZJR2_9RHOB
MTKHQQNYQPGPIFNDVACGALRALGSRASTFAERIGSNPQNLRNSLIGYSNNEAAQRVREELIKAIGPDLFALLYAERIKREGLGK